ncbi:MAG: fumarate hydratase [Candidatus Omnitrophica bacterium]|nr:fumarate hydratase [Candidatus Omnitrophota bacterium]
MRTRYIDAEIIKNTIKDLCIQANTILRPDVLEAIKELYRRESDGFAKNMLGALIQNADIARRDELALCQDTGMVTVFITVGGDVFIRGGNITEAVNEGVAAAYEEGHFRKSVVADPLLRGNTGTNTPAIVHIDVIGGDKLMIAVMPKGFGSENKSRTIMLNPTAGSDEIVEFCVETVKLAGPDACPPYVLGVGLGGTMEQCASLAKKALLRPLNIASSKPHLAELEDRIKKKVNELKIGVMGLGGASTVLAAVVETTPTHIAGLPMAVNLSCHALRSASAVI